MRATILILLAIFIPFNANCQIDENKVGAWYMLFLIHSQKDSKILYEGDIQYRNWNIGNDLQQLIIRGSINYKLRPDAITFGTGYGYFHSEAFGESKVSIFENRLHQDILFKNKIDQLTYFIQRIRLEERWIESLNFTSRLRFNLIVNVPLNKKSLTENTLFVSAGNELFFNLIKDVGTIKNLNAFDRNWTSVNLGYQFKRNRKVQFGIMHEITNFWNKTQFQFIYTHTL